MTEFKLLYECISLESQSIPFSQNDGIVQFLVLKHPSAFSFNILSYYQNA